VLTRHFDSDRTYLATAPGRQPSEPIPPVGLVGWSTFSDRASYVDLQGEPRRGPVLPGGGTRAGTPTPLTSPFVAHGINRNAQNYFGSIERAATNIGVAETTIIVAPRFQIEKDEREHHDAYWMDSGRNPWKDGGGSLAPAGLSSFKVMDEVLTALADNDRFPGLTRITLVGHSAGGQFTQRYAAGGRAPDTLRGVTIGYVTANPSSYLYLNSYRPIGEKLLESWPGIQRLQVWVG
jgi:hypothetical protein